MLCIGNPARGDDAVGHAVATLLRPLAPVDVRIIEHDAEATTLLAALERARSVWLVDAAISDAPAGTIHRIDLTTMEALPSGSVSSHGFGAAEAIGLARALGTLPEHCVAYAVEAAQFTPGAPLSAAVADAAKEVVIRLLEELATRPPP